MPAGPLALAFLLLCFHLASRVLAAASLGFYEDGACQTGLAWTTATNPNGTCTDVTGSFGSVKVMLVDSGCAVTAYATNNSYCGDGYKYALQWDVCVPASNLDVNQFTEDCQNAPALSASSTDSTSQSTASISASKPSSSNSASSTTSGTSSTSSSSNSNPSSSSIQMTLGLSLGLGIPSFVVTALGTYIGYLQLKKARAKKRSSYVTTI